MSLTLRLAIAAPALLGACASPPAAQAPDLQGLLPAPLLLLGEQHDAPEHQALQQRTVQALADQGRLAAVVLEMAEHGQQTAGLPPDAPQQQVREALAWTGPTNAGGWAWDTYGPVVMAAVRAGVPVLGGNLPRDRMRAAMADTSLDAKLPPEALRRQREAIREGHCNLLPESQLTPMTRIQLARDRSLAGAASAALRDGKTVLLIAGNQHVDRELGVPRHLPPDQAVRVVQALAQDAPPAAAERAGADRFWLTPARPARDHCAELKQQMSR